jgi:xylulose-5-phosphate/fructose-6-phosphate phosphoketolase
VAKVVLSASFSSPFCVPQRGEYPATIEHRLLTRMDADWRASNCLSVGQIYLLDNPLLKEPLKHEHVKPRPIAHWGTTPGLNLMYTHLSRIMKNQDLDISQLK